MFFRPTHLIIHHSETKDSGTVSWGAIRKYHTTVKRPRWSDIGYHFGVEDVNGFPEMLLGRMPNLQGAHCYAQGMNRKALGLCVIGNFDLIEPPELKFDLAARVSSWICQVLCIPTENILGHGEVDARKTCPGLKFDMNKFRVRVNIVNVPFLGPQGG